MSEIKSVEKRICLLCRKLVSVEVTIHETNDEEIAELKEEGVESPRLVSSTWACPECGNVHF